MPLPTLEPLATHTPLPTYTPYPTPTATPKPTPTRRPTATPTVVPQVWRNTANWYRDSDFERGIDLSVKIAAPGVEYEVKVATLDATPNASSKDLYLSLACLDDIPLMYLGAYGLEVPSWVVSYSFEIWDETREDWVGGAPEYFDPTLTDDGASIYITNRSEQREILSALRGAAGSLPDGHILVAGMWPSVESDDQHGLVSALDSSGIGDALRYLGCF